MIKRYCYEIPIHVYLFQCCWIVFDCQEHGGEATNFIRIELVAVSLVAVHALALQNLDVVTELVNLVLGQLCVHPQVKDTQAVLLAPPHLCVEHVQDVLVAVEHSKVDNVVVRADGVAVSADLLRAEVLLDPEVGHRLRPDKLHHPVPGLLDSLALLPLAGLHNHPVHGALHILSCCGPDNVHHLTRSFKQVCHPFPVVSKILKTVTSLPKTIKNYPKDILPSGGGFLVPELVAEGAPLLRLLGGGEVDGEPLLQGGQLVLRRLHLIARTLLFLSNCVPLTI